MLSTRALAAALCGVVLAAVPVCGQTAQQEMEASIQSMRATGGLGVTGARLPASAVIAAVYERRQFALLWNDSRRRASVASAVGRLSADGLDPSLYDHAGLVARSRAGATQPADSARDDLLFTHIMLLAAQHLRFGRVDPGTLALRRSIERPLHGADAVEAAERLLAADPVAALYALRPAHVAYFGLVRELARLREGEAAGSWPAVPAGSLRHGSSGDAVRWLRLRLHREGDLPPGADTASTVYDDVVERAVRSFQHRHAIAEDGIVGPATHRELGVPIGDRIRQVRVNLERARWLVHDLPDTFIVVNVAGAIVYFVRNGEVVFESRTVVGTNATRTPVFRATLQQVDLNPAWTVPPGIVQEVLNALRRNPDYLRTQGMIVLNAAGRRVNPSGIDFRRYNGRTFPWVFQQQPGPLNPLGQVRFSFPNRHHVYLHDTPARNLFASDNRTFSHGCIRVQDPVRLAELVLADPAWDGRRLRAAIAEGRSRSILLQQPLPVIVQYWTAATDRHGELHFYRDVYGRDEPLWRALQRPR
jgi:L,D-transpeptidase YcbB